MAPTHLKDHFELSCLVRYKGELRKKCIWIQSNDILFHPFKLAVKKLTCCTIKKWISLCTQNQKPAFMSFFTAKMSVLFHWLHWLHSICAVAWRGGSYFYISTVVRVRDPVTKFLGSRTKYGIYAQYGIHAQGQEWSFQTFTYVVQSRVDLVYPASHLVWL